MNSPTPPASTPSAADLQTLLNEDRARPWWQRPTPWLIALALLVLAAGLTYWLAQKKTGAAPHYVTETVRKGNLTLNVLANGTLQPTRSVNIGSELSGTVKRVLVDVNDRIRKGQVLVELDTAKLSDQVLRSRASLAAMQAQLAQSAATVKETRAGLTRFEEVARLSGGKVPSATELDSARASVDRAVAAEASARANVAEARAAASTDETNLAKASIRSPIDGVVLTRTVDPGNAVAASLQAVTLFTVAEDLAQLRLEVNVDEADVGSVKVGQKASFTVSAYPSRRYPATITRVAFGSTKTDNVVTYVTYLEVNNTDLSLRPGMTAAATIVATERVGVLLVPNTALRFTPTQVDSPAAAASSGSFVSKLMPRMPRTSARKPADTTGGAGTRQVWVLKDNQAAAVSVKTGISDGRMTEVTGDGLQEGMAVITDQQTAGATP
ncbi:MULTISPECIES: efflux RND transporter periplasmic adaptor subunit [unclassified Polaromonas]|jgi:HlyD family secretion protein|uniref:efflux RND transporter periplasmic adaptor subunit n=1 Tax=unclassified Polaromonas TaxID=2638319 RepID=UPI000BCBF2A1|nr:MULTISPECIES: efflux RND transporter periplasmic adaptor subunit [unclassified Polaromonas]OYY39665.1 MAG: efflux transporter periplasmic adaptor subunit [Polaromonas sp. 35-63-35]OYZ22410.1 MAG: efflux transporter periplasmic adaptor subunit [Polaromonas sp. 16-63-31]OYZ81369.1 MAG: efflux transporter periplasmic adaptor subunit [Polaromonas sp. 24-63-21]OZA52405.1 MAG: efflux transporter periplasmic adaptor subunit [Polaromonas sp. 17-63-33]OZA88730.1 MAG: efflux transporter periplasmic a